MGVDYDAQKVWAEVWERIRPTPADIHQSRTAYVASRFKNRELVTAFSAKLLTKKPPIHCIQSWSVPGSVMDQWTEAACAEQDVQEILSVPRVIVLTENCELTPGGMNFETGFAYAKGKRVIVVGPRVHVFHYLPQIEWYPSIQAYFESFGADAWEV